MPRYRVKMTYMTDVDIDVEADDVEAAKEAASVAMLDVEMPERPWSDEFMPTKVTLLAPTNAQPKHDANGYMTPDAHAAYLAAIKPVTDLRNTEHDAWRWVDGEMTYAPDDVWRAAELTSQVLLRAFHESYADGEPADDGIDFDIDDMATWE